MNSVLNPSEATGTEAQAKALIALLPAVMRNLFRLDDDLATELPLAQLRVCSILLHEGPRSMSMLGREMGVSLSAMTQIADRLERSRLVKRVSEGTDRRVRCLQLTPHGERIMHRRDEERLQAATAVLENLSPRDRQDVLKSLEILRNASVAAAENGNRGEAAFTEMRTGS
jgi:DNA-binding MarR family transcriptional regulator